MPNIFVLQCPSLAWSLSHDGTQRSWSRRDFKGTAELLNTRQVCRVEGMLQTADSPSSCPRAWGIVNPNWSKSCVEPSLSGADPNWF